MKTAETWAKRNECKILLIVILLFPAVHIYLLTMQLRLTIGYSFLVVLLVTRFVLGSIAYKNGWIKRTPKQRRIIYTLTSGVVVSLGTQSFGDNSPDRFQPTHYQYLSYYLPWELCLAIRFGRNLKSIRC